VIGRTLGHHRIIGELGKGGMGVVYLAEDTRLGRRVALKVLPPDLAADPARQARFEREARAVAALNHPNIVTIHSVEQADGVHFLTMELVDGRRLTETLSRDGVALPRLLEWSVGIADALGAAHRQGVVHRDLKPDNIMVTSEGRIKVLDFGLAKLRETSPEQGHTALATASVTEEGKILGTVSYMSPEQAEGKPLDHRSDIFSFGVVLYELATGRRPFQGDTAISTISSILKDTPPPPQQINTTLPPQLGRIVRRCLAKEPERRYQSTDDLRNELREVKEESESGELTVERQTTGTVSASRRGGTRAVMLAGAGLAVVAAIAAGFLWLRPRGAEEAPRTTSGELQMSRATTDGRVAEAAISPDGRYVAYVRREGPRASLRLRQLVTGEEVQVVAPTVASLLSLSFSGDGDFLHYVQIEPGFLSGWVYRVSVLGGTPRRLLDGANGVSGSPDGRLLGVMARTMEESILRLTGPDGENPRDLSSRKGRDHFDSSPAWSPDGRSAAIVSHRFGEPQQIVVFDQATGSERTVPAPSLRSFDSLAWMPGSDALLVTGSERPVNQGGAAQIWAISPGGKASPLTRDLNSYSYISVTKDGTTLAAVQDERRSGIDVAAVKDGAPGPLTELFPISAARSGNTGIAWLTGNRLVHGAVQGDERQIFVTDVESKSSRSLTSGPPHRSAAASRDGRTVVVMRDEGSHSFLWRVDPDTGRGEKLSDGPSDGFPVVGPDGSWVAYSSVTDSVELFRKPTAGGAPVSLNQGSTRCVDASADGSLLCLQALPSGEARAILMPPSGGEPQRLQVIPANAALAKFGPDGRSLTWTVSVDGAEELWSATPGNGEPRRLARFEGREISDYAWSPDGTRLAVVKYANSGDVVLLRRPPS
jgi:Tol biopolymer transport system component/predicted Ser/Thr protein kinase